MTKFPDGISGLADKIHDLGLKIGIYSSAGTMTCARYEGSLGYETKDATVWAEWGVSRYRTPHHSEVQVSQRTGRLSQIRQLLQPGPGRYGTAFL